MMGAMNTVTKKMILVFLVRTTTAVVVEEAVEGETVVIDMAEVATVAEAAAVVIDVIAGEISMRTSADPKGWWLVNRIVHTKKTMQACTWTRTITGQPTVA
jgi:hypothetical protein